MDLLSVQNPIREMTRTFVSGTSSGEFGAPPSPSFRGSITRVPGPGRHGNSDPSTAQGHREIRIRGGATTVCDLEGVDDLPERTHPSFSAKPPRNSPRARRVRGERYRSCNAGRRDRTRTLYEYLSRAFTAQKWPRNRARQTPNCPGLPSWFSARWNALQARPQFRGRAWSQCLS